MAIRDAESRVRFLGYSVTNAKLFVFTVSAILAGIAGALYVPQVGIINPSELSPGNSIEIAIWVAVGGRGTLFGAIIGAFTVNGAKSFFTGAAPEIWLFFLGALFIVCTLFLPQGIVGFAAQMRDGSPGKRHPHQRRSAMLRASTAPDTAELEPPVEATPIRTARQPAGSILYLDGVSVSFDGFKALNNLSLVIDKGELRTIIGPNGAGKTTMMDVITGKTRPDKGDVLFDGNGRSDQAGRGADRQSRHRPQVPEADGVRAPDRVREPGTRPEADSAAPSRTLFFHLTGRQARADRCDPGVIGLGDRRKEKAGALSHGQKQWLEIGMLLMQDRPASAAGRAGRRHDRPRDRDDGPPAPRHRARALDRRGRARHGVRPGAGSQGDRAARGLGPGRRLDRHVQADHRVIEVYLGR